MLCDFALRFPKFAADFLERGQPLRRRFREESLTDIMMASLVTLQSGGIVVEFPDEPRTGADMEWNFVRIDESAFFRIYVQAKRLYGDGNIWTRHCYRELLHITGGSGTLQAQVLADTARQMGSGCFPLYAFYNPERACNLAEADGVNQLAGVNLADGFAIEALAKSSTNQTLRTRNKSLKTLHPLFFLLRDLFCPPESKVLGPMERAEGSVHLAPAYYAGGGQLRVTTPPTPETIRQRLEIKRQSILELLSVDSAELFTGLPEVPEIVREVPRDVRAVLNAYRERIPLPGREGINRWRVTFVSPPVDSE